MNKNDKLSGITPSENKNDTNELNDDSLESVAGGISLADMLPKPYINPNPVPPITAFKKCPSCGKNTLSYSGTCYSCGYNE